MGVCSEDISGVICTSESPPPHPIRGHTSGRSHPSPLLRRAPHPCVSSGPGAYQQGGGGGSAYGSIVHFYNWELHMASSAI